MAASILRLLCRKFCFCFVYDGLAGAWVALALCGIIWLCTRFHRMGMVFAAIMPILVVLPGAYLAFNNDASLNSIPIVGTTLLLPGGHGYFNPWTLRCPPICRYLDPAGAFRIIGAGCGNRAEYRSDWA
jgi:hypothetical protein